MAKPASFLNFPNRATWGEVSCAFNKSTDFGLWNWNASGHSAPVDINQATSGNGSVTLGSGNASAQSYVQAQLDGFSVLMSTLGQEWDFIFNASISSAAATSALLGACVSNSNVMGTNIVNGFGFACNQNGGPATGNWYAFVANAASAQFSGYQQFEVNVTDTAAHTFSIAYLNNGTVVGGGQMVFSIDNVAVWKTGVSGVASFPATSYLSPTFAMGNLTGTPNTMTVYEASMIGGR